MSSFCDENHKFADGENHKNKSEEDVFSFSNDDDDYVDIDDENNDINDDGNGFEDEETRH